MTELIHLNVWKEASTWFQSSLHDCFTVKLMEDSASVVYVFIIEILDEILNTPNVGRLACPRRRLYEELEWIPENSGFWENPDSQKDFPKSTRNPQSCLHDPESFKERGPSKGLHHSAEVSVVLKLRTSILRLHKSNPLVSWTNGSQCPDLKPPPPKPPC